MPLGDKFKCEIDGCGKPAYKKCHDYLGPKFGKVWKGCGKYICPEHLEVFLEKRETNVNGNKTVVFLENLNHCKSKDTSNQTECNVKFNAIYPKYRCVSLISILTAFAFFMIGII